MENILIVSNSQKAADFFKEGLAQTCAAKIAVTNSTGEARGLMSGENFDLCIVNSPLPDGLGDELAADISKTELCQVILVTNPENYEALAAEVEPMGVLVLPKPVTKAGFRSAVLLAKATYARMSGLKDKNAKRQRKIEDMHLIDRAKGILIDYLSMTESEAHRYIEKQSMNLRISKRKIAENIIKIYEL